MSFVHLRVHSEYSFLRSACRLEELVLRAKELGMPAVALTDYGVVHGAVRFTQLALQHGLQPILGVELNLSSGLPVVLLVRNKTGWGNLLRLINGCQLSQPAKAWLEPQELADHYEGLSLVLHPSYQSFSLNTVEKALTMLQPIFAAELYLALADTGLPGTSRFNQQLAALAQTQGVSLLASQNVHYVLSGEESIFWMVNCIRTGKPLAGARQAFLPGSNYHLATPAEMWRRFASFPQACDTTLFLAQKCSFVLQREGRHLPTFHLPNDEAAESALPRLCREGLQRTGLRAEVALRRLERELAVILPKGLAAYFLIVQDLVNYARRAGIPVGPGRGSAGGSLVAYLLGITQVDPLAHGLYFERFISEDRVEFPDIDIDVCQRRRGELLDYLRSRYGEGRVAQVSTFSTLGARAAVREVGKILDASGDKVSAVAEALPHYSDQGGIEAALRQFPEFQQARLRDETAQAILVGARRLEGLCRHLSTHASGVILGLADLAEAAPLCRGPAGEVLTQWDKDDVEAMGFLKLDVLGSRNLTIIHDTLASVAARHGGAPTVEKIVTDDQATFAMLRRGESLGCFQLESAGMRRVLRLLVPERLEDLIHLLSLYRPGPWESGMVETFVARQRGQEETTYLHPALAEILAETHGVVLYQEQVMRIACAVGGYTAGEADQLRREMGRRAPSLQEVHRLKFITGAVQKGFSTKDAGDIFDHLCRFAGYGFNKAHSAAYALFSYWTAYLKQHYPVEYYAALLSAGFGYYGSAVYIHEARRRGIEILPPHVNYSEITFQPEGSAIRAALSLVRDLGARGAATIIDARAHEPYTSLQDFCQRVGRSALRRKALANLVKAGGLAGLGLNRRQALAALDHVLKWTDRQPGQLSLWPWLTEENTLPSLPDFSAAEVITAEAETLGLSLSQHPLQPYRSQLKHGHYLQLQELSFRPAGQEVTVAAAVLARSRRRLKKGGVMLTLLLSDESGFAEAIFYPDVYKRLLYSLNEDLLVLTGHTTTDGDAIIVQQALPLWSYCLQN
ncbi:MAG TPA: DNA polymerase III subunit alpha [Oscillospiraceae bacterium]|nr:DNA polymerase III subunit alpha [Oscillospiraceae bacterium]